MIETDAVIIGAGPVGLFQVFQLGLLEIQCHVVDSLPHAGGQCVELYADKPIFDIPGTPRCTGRQLVASLLRQAQPFKADFHLGHDVSALEQQADGRFRLTTSGNLELLAKTVFIAAGVGAFQPKLIKVDGIDRFAGKQLFYRVEDFCSAAGTNLLIVGGDEAALSAAVTLASTADARPGSITLLHRREVLQAAPELLARFKTLCDEKIIEFRVGQVTGFQESSGNLSAVLITGADGQTGAHATDAMLVLLGLSPRLGPIAQWGLDMERKQLKVDTEKFSTSVRGIFAVGDVNCYPGKKKLILSGFHEAALAAFGAAEIVFPGRVTPLQYTTTSPRLHKLLGEAAGDRPA